MKPSDHRYEQVLKTVQLASRKWERLHGREPGEYLGRCWELAMKAVDRFDASRGASLASYIATSISFGLRDDNAKEYARRKHEVTLDAMVPCGDEGPSEGLERREEVEKLLNLLDDRSKAIMVLVYLEGRSRQSVATLFGVKRAAIDRVIRLAKARMRGDRQ